MEHIRKYMDFPIRLTDSGSEMISISFNEPLTDHPSFLNMLFLLFHRLVL